MLSWAGLIPAMLCTRVFSDLRRGGASPVPARAGMLPWLLQQRWGSPEHRVPREILTARGRAEPSSPQGEQGAGSTPY